MRLVGWLGVVSVGAVLLLEGAEGADDKRPMPADTEVKALTQKVAALEARLKVLEGVVQVSGYNVKLVSSQGLTLQAGTSVALQGGTSIAIQGGSTVGVTGAAGVDIRGATLMLNGGGRPLARVGDTVVLGSQLGKITTGSPTILGQ